MVLSRHIPARVVGAISGLSGFAVAVIAGMSAGNGVASVLATAIAGLFVCQLIGFAVGLAAERALTEQVEFMRSAASGAAARESRVEADGEEAGGGEPSAGGG